VIFWAGKGEEGDRNVLGHGLARLPGGAAAAVAGHQRDGVQEEGSREPGEQQARRTRRRRHGHRLPRRRRRPSEGGAGVAGDVLPREHPRRGGRSGGVAARAPAVGG
jgi:hypothetical protein